MRGNHGQFYIMAAIVIIVIIVSLVTVKNYISSPNRPSNLLDLSQEFGLEGGTVIDNGIIDSEVDLQLQMKDFAEKYSAYIGQDKTLKVIIGDESDGTLYLYTIEEQPAGSVNFGSSEVKIEQVDASRTPLEPVNGKITVAFKDQNYVFDVQEGENFYFLIAQESGGEQFVTTG